MAEDRSKSPAGRGARHAPASAGSGRARRRPGSGASPTPGVERSAGRPRGGGRTAGTGGAGRAAGRGADAASQAAPALPRIARRRSRLHGWGVFALEEIPKNKRIIAYEGERITHAESRRRERRYLRNGHIWCFKLNNRWVIDANVGGNEARFINHSCTPNCYTQIIDGVIWVRAARTIRRGEELTYNYHTDGEGLIPCRCRPGCTNLL
jgi:hypothetical protein